MTRKQMTEALRKDAQRKLAARAERIVVSQYPHDHNPYLPHLVGDDCFPVCVDATINRVLSKTGRS